MARCPDCNKFVGVEQQEVEDFEPDIEVEVPVGRLQSGSVSGEVHLVLACVDCGTELSESNQDVEAEFTVEHDEDCEALFKPDEAGVLQPLPEGSPPPELEAEDVSVAIEDTFEGKGRGARHYYGASISMTITCPGCKGSAEVQTEVNEQASSFESMV